MSPLELAWRLWGERRRMNTQLRLLAWTVSMVMAPHVSQSDRSKVSSNVLFHALAGFRLDEDEV